MDVATRLHLLREAMREAKSTIWIPHNPTPKQAEFLALDTPEGLFGGAAGGGKSDALLMWLLGAVDVPGYAGLGLRRTIPELKQPGGLIPRSHEWLSNTKAHWVGNDKEWRFPSGARVRFGHLQYEHDKHQYQSGEYQRIAWDELTSFMESQYLYVQSRKRRTRNVDVIPQSRAATNPGNKGHEWVGERFIDPGHPSRPFIPSRIEDNPYLDQESYREALSVLPETTRRQLELGEWIRDSQGLIYPLRAKNLLDAPPDTSVGDWRYVLGVDLGASEAKPTTSFVVVGWDQHHPRVTYAMESSLEGQELDVTAKAERIRQYLDRGGFSCVVMDEGALGKDYGKEFRRRHRLPVQPAQKAGKHAYRKLLRGALERGELVVVEPGNEGLIKECHSLAWNEAGTDNEKGKANHLTDALLYAWRWCYNFAQTEKPPEPQREDERLRALEEKHLEAERAAVRRQQQGLWWRR